MVKISDKSREFIERKFNNLENDAKNFINKDVNSAEDLFKMTDVNDVLDVISDYLNFYGFDENDQITDYGRDIEKVYDDIYDDN